MKQIYKWVCRLSQVSGMVAALLMVVSVFVVCQMIFVRAVLGESSIWQTEFVTYALVAATFLGAPYILLTKGHVNVDLLPLFLSHKASIAVAWVASIASLSFCLLFLYSALHWWYEAWNLDLTTPSIWRARLWIPYLSVPVGMTLLCLQYVVDIWALATGRDMPFGMDPSKQKEMA